MDIDIRKDLYGEKIKQVEDDMLPFGFIDGGTEQSFEIDTSGQVWFIAE